MNAYFTKARGPLFHEVPYYRMASAFGVNYAVLNQPDGGILYVTKHGWPWRANLLPDCWFHNKKYYREGTLLPGGTGHVYHLATTSPVTNNIAKEWVIKVNRIAQFVPIDVPDFFYDKISQEEAQQAHFLDPFEEFGLLEELRHGVYGPEKLNILTKRPMAIYCPPDKIPLWKSGRKRSDFARYKRRLKNNQDNVEDFEHVVLDINKDYIALFEYVRGHDAEYYHQQGLLSKSDLQALTRRVGEHLAAKGFRMLDLKPKHFILREREPRKLLTYRGELCYGLIDFELLMRTEQYKDYLNAHLNYQI